MMLLGQIKELTQNNPLNLVQEMSEKSSSNERILKLLEQNNEILEKIHHIFLHGSPTIFRLDYFSKLYLGSYWLYSSNQYLYGKGIRQLCRSSKY